MIYGDVFHGGIRSVHVFRGLSKFSQKQGHSGFQHLHRKQIMVSCRSGEVTSGASFYVHVFFDSSRLFERQRPHRYWISLDSTVLVGCLLLLVECT